MLNLDTLFKVKLFIKKEDYLLFSLIVLTLLSFSLSYHYQKYLELKQFTWHTIPATVISQAHVSNVKNPYTLYKLKADNFTFTTSNKKVFKPLIGRLIELTIFTEKINFLEYLKGFYTQSAFKALMREKSPRLKLLETIHQQHNNPRMANLFGALFLAEPIEKKLRENLTALGINHLAAISGFHLGILSLLTLLVLNVIYKPIHQRFIPYRNKQRDVMLVTLVALFFYVSFLEFPPSLLRAYTMMLIGFILYDRHMELLSFHSLALTIILLLALFPSLVFSLGFWFSVLGVFKLFLVLKHFSDIKKWQLFLLLHIIVFILMTPWVIYIFGSFSVGQFYSPLLSMLFILFYPLTLLLSALGFTDTFDSYLLSLFQQHSASIALKINIELFLAFVLASILSITYKRVFIGLTGIVLSILVYVSLHSNNYVS